MEEQELNKLVGHLFRHEAGRMAAVLTRLLGFNAFDLAEDIVQDSLLQAMWCGDTKEFLKIRRHGCIQ